MSQDNEAEKDVATVTPPKYSRYRSVRRAAKESPPVLQSSPEPATAPVVPENNDHIAKRSMSRYRHPKTGPRHDQLASPPAHTSPPVAAASPPPYQSNNPYNPYHPINPNNNPYRSNNPYNPFSQPVRRATEPVPAKQRYDARSASVGRQIPQNYQETESERLQREAREAQEQEEQERRARQQQEEEEQRILRETEEKLAEQKRKDLERLEATLDAAVQAPAAQKVSTPVIERLNFFSRKRAKTKTSPPAASSVGTPSLSTTRSRASNDTPPKSNELPRQGSEQGESTYLPGTDAPISAVNSGERRVLVRYRQSSINLPVTPDTTPFDIILSAAKILSHSIAPSSTVMFESYTQLGLERRVRRYERIRDIMNSWDRDTQNALVLQKSDAPKFDIDLESVPLKAPAGVTVHMHHSQRPNRWNKRYITILSSGQVIMSKKSESKMTDKDVVSLCHLSDFDIYSPTATQLGKLKPPKEFCYAVKSQQKTTMFMNTENFVHFFSTDDESTAQRLYDTVQRWRSWYLVHKMGDGKKKGKKSEDLTDTQTGTKTGPGHKGRRSVDDNEYVIGSSKPMRNRNRFGSEGDEYDSEEENRPRQIPFHLRNSILISPSAAKLDEKRHPPPVSYRLPPEAEEEFAATSLLGRSYSQRLKAQKEREAQAQPSGPFVDGPSLLNGGIPQRSQSTRKARPEPVEPGTGGLGGHKPLLDFTPQFKEAPQWDKSGKGRGVVPPSGVPLVEAATTPDFGLDLPQTTLFRRDASVRRPGTSAGGGAFIKGGLISGKS